MSEHPACNFSSGDTVKHTPSNKICIVLIIKSVYHKIDFPLHIIAIPTKTFWNPPQKQFNLELLKIDDEELNFKHHRALLIERTKKLSFE